MNFLFGRSRSGRSAEASADPTHEARAHPSRVSRVSILAGATLPLVLIALVGASILHQRRDALADAERTNNEFGVILAEQAERTLQAVDLVMQETVAGIDPTKVTTDEQFTALFGSSSVHDFLADRIRNLPQVDAITVIDANARLVNFSRYWPIPALSFTDRDYYQYFLTHDDRGVFVSAPVQNRGDNTWTFYMVRRINGADGGFRGMILGAIKLSYFADLYKAVTPPDGGSTQVLRRDGMILVRYPNETDRAGQLFQPGSPWYTLVQHGGGDFRSPGYFYGKPRLVSAHPMHRYPLVVNTALSQESVLAHWRGESIDMALGTAGACLALLIFLVVLNWQFGRLERGSRLLKDQALALHDTAEALRASENQLAEKSAALQLTLDQMDQGLMMIDGAGTVAISNRRALEILDLPAELMAAKPQFHDVLRYQLASGNFDPGLRTLQGSEVINVPSVYDRTRPDGRVIEVRSVPLAGGGAVRTYTDISARKAAEERMRYLAHHDDLTQLANRVVFLERLNKLVARSGRRHGNEGRGLAVLYLDLDRFKLVNDTRGHQVGDRLLAEVARRIRATLRDTDLAARMGGDEFAIIQSRVDQPSSAKALARRLLETIGAPYDILGQLSVIGVSIGIAVFPADGTTADQLLRNADTALYRAKEDGRNTIRFFEPAMDIRHQERALLEQDLREAVLRRQFHLVYQPICDAKNQQITSFETLMRWNHPLRGPIAPDEFIPLAESSGLIVPLGLWALEAACRDAVGWARPLRVSVNLSPMQFRQNDLPDQVAEILLRTGLPGDRLDLEVTEGLLLDDADVVLSTMRELQQHGIRIALDDFGTGYASLSYLRRFPFDHIKIDRSFVQSMADDKGARAIVESILTLSARLNLTVVAEGVETEEQLALLRQLECHRVQGFLLGAPVTAEAVGALLMSREHTQVGVG